MITTELKDWLAKNAGVGSCFSSTGVSYRDPDGASRTGSTGDVLNTFLVASMINKTTVIIRANASYNTIKAINKNNTITFDDVKWVYSNDGTGTESKYCVSGGTTPPPSTEPTDESRAGTFTFVAPPTGDPTVNLNLSEIIMRQAGDGHFEMNDVKITNTSQNTAYIAMRIRLFQGDIPACKDTGYIFDGMDRTDTVNRSLRIKTLDPGETGVYNTDFFQPTHIRGVHTVCMLVHGAWTRSDLEAEVQGVVG